MMTEHEARIRKVEKLELEIRKLRHAMWLDNLAFQKQLREVAAIADIAFVSHVAIYGEAK